MLRCVVTDFFLNNQPDALIIQIYSVIKLYMFRAFSLPIIRRIFYCTFGIGKFHAGFWWPLPSRVRMELRFHSDSAWKRSSKPAWNLPMQNVQKRTPDDGQIKCPKQVEFYDW